MGSFASEVRELGKYEFKRFRTSGQAMRAVVRVGETIFGVGRNDWVIYTSDRRLTRRAVFVGDGWHMLAPVTTALVRLGLEDESLLARAESVRAKAEARSIAREIQSTLEDLENAQLVKPDAITRRVLAKATGRKWRPKAGYYSRENEKLDIDLLTRKEESDGAA